MFNIKVSLGDRVYPLVVTQEQEEAVRAAAKLLNDQEVYDKLNKTLTDLNEILADVRRNPGKYTKGLIKVF